MVKWIPIFEDRPKKSGVYLCTVDHGSNRTSVGERYYYGENSEIMDDYCDENGWWSDFTTMWGHVIAWLPTIEPYDPSNPQESFDNKTSLEYRYAVFDECDRQFSEILDTYKEASDFCKELRESYPHSDYNVKRILMGDWEEC